MLKEYINNILEKDIIKELKLLAINLILQALKVKNLVKKFYVKKRSYIIISYFIIFLYIIKINSFKAKFKSF